MGPEGTVGLESGLCLNGTVGLESGLCLNGAACREAYCVWKEDCA